MFRRLRENASYGSTSTSMIPQVEAPKSMASYMSGAGMDGSKKKKKKSAKKDEHIQGENNRISFMHNGQEFIGWVEKRSSGEFDVAVIKGNFEIVKSVTKKDVVQRVRAAAEKLSKKTATSSSQKKRTPDMVLPPDED